MLLINNLDNNRNCIILVKLFVPANESKITRNVIIMHPLIEQCLTLNISKLLNEYLPAAFEEDSLVQNGLL